MHDGTPPARQPRRSARDLPGDRRPLLWTPALDAAGAGDAGHLPARPAGDPARSHRAGPHAVGGGDARDSRRGRRRPRMGGGARGFRARRRDPPVPDESAREGPRPARPARIDLGRGRGAQPARRRHRSAGRRTPAAGRSRRDSGPARKGRRAADTGRDPPRHRGPGRRAGALHAPRARGAARSHALVDRRAGSDAHHARRRRRHAAGEPLPRNAVGALRHPRADGGHRAPP